MLSARTVDHAVSLIRSDQLSLDELYKYLTINETNFEFDINAGSDANGTTVLHAACAANNAELTQELLLLGANPNQVSNIGRTPLQEALEAKSLGCVKILMAHGAKVSDEQNFKEMVSSSTPKIQQFIQSFLTKQSESELAVIRKQESSLKIRLTAAKIALVKKFIEEQIERYKRNAQSFFGINNTDKAKRLETALQNALASLNTINSVEAFLNYQHNNDQSISSVLSERRIGFSEPQGKLEVDQLVSKFRL